MSFVSPYIRCPSCELIIFDGKYELSEIAKPCPKCGATGDYRQIWPAVSGHLWMEHIFSHPLERPIDQSILAVLLCATAEVMLEDLITNILIFQNAQNGHIDILIKTHQGHARYLSLFKKLSRSSLKEALVGINSGAFYDSWEKIVTSRNEFVHGVPPRELSPHFPTKTDLETVRNGMLEAFVQLYNKFAVCPQGMAKN